MLVINQECPPLVDESDFTLVAEHIHLGGKSAAGWGKGVADAVVAALPAGYRHASGGYPFIVGGVGAAGKAGYETLRCLATVAETWNRLKATPTVETAGEFREVATAYDSVAGVEVLDKTPAMRVAVNIPRMLVTAEVVAAVDMHTRSAKGDLPAGIWGKAVACELIDTDALLAGVVADRFERAAVNLEAEFSVDALAEVVGWKALLKDDGACKPAANAIAQKHIEGAKRTNTTWQPSTVVQTALTTWGKT